MLKDRSKNKEKNEQKMEVKTYDERKNH